MNNTLQIFNNEEFGQVRTTEINGQPYFVGSDIAKVLGYGEPHKAITRHCKGWTKRPIGVQTGIKADGTPAAQEIEMLVIPESDVYRLIIKSKLPSAERFERWVMEEVIPSIRKYNIYATDEVIDKMLDDPALSTRLLSKLREEKEKTRFLSEQMQESKELIEELQPKATYYDRILQGSDLLTITEIAKDYGMSAKAFNKLLKEKRIQFYQNGRWFLYSKHEGKGYTQSKTQLIEHRNGTGGHVTHMYWTQKGRMFLYTTLQKYGIVPAMEK